MRLYISYASVDRHAVRELVGVLDSAGHEPWFDLWLFPGQDWRQQTVVAIEKSEAFVLVLTPDSVESEWCHWELSKALEQGRPIIPVLLHAKTPIPGELSAYQYVDFTEGPTPEAVARLLSWLQPGAAPSPQSTSRITSEIASAPQPVGGERRLFGLEDRASLLLAAISAVVLVFTFPPGTADSRLAHEEARLLVVFLASTLAFSLLRHVALSVVVFLGLQTFLLVGHLSTPELLWPDYLFLAALLSLGYALGRTRLLFWPWLSWQVVWQHRRLRSQPADEATVERLVALLDAPVLVAPYTAMTAMQTLVANGLDFEDFTRRTTNPVRQAQYRRIALAAGLEKLKQTDRLEDVAQIPHLDDLISIEQLSVEALLQAVQDSDNPLEEIRAYAQFLRKLENAWRVGIRDQQALSASQREALEHVIRLMDRAIEQAKVLAYWSAYDALNAIVEQLPPVVPLPGEPSGQRAAVQNALRQVTRTTDLVQQIEDKLPLFPDKERRWYRSMQETGLINDQYLSVAYQERQTLLSREIGRLQILVQGQPTAWLTIDRTAIHVIEHANPWRVIASQLAEHLERVQQLDTQYVAWAARAVSAVLKDIGSIEQIAELEQALGALITSGDSFGPMVEDTVQALLAIGNDTRAALELPPGTYHHRQTLIDAQDKSNQLRNSLRTRYMTPEPLAWADAVQKISTLLDDYLNAQRDTDQATYRNPYIVGNPIEPKNAALFKGRIELAQEIVDKLRGDNRPTLILYGPRRMGKTSFLLQLQNLLKGRGNYIPIFFDAQEPRVRQNDASFFYTLARAIYVQMKSQARGKRIKSPEMGQFEAYPYATISTWIEEEVLPLLNHQVLLITIDEFESLGGSIRAGELTEKILDYLRHTMQHSEKQLFLFCGAETLEALGPNAASYFIGAQAIELSYLSDEAAEELIRDPNPDAGEMPDYDDDVVAEIMRLTHRQPYLIQAICSRIIDLANDQNLKHIDAATLDEALPALFTKNRLYFSNIWDDTDEAGRPILSTLAHGPARLSEEQSDSPSVQVLLKRRVIQVRPDGLYEIEIPLVQQWVAEQVMPLA